MVAATQNQKASHQTENSVSDFPVEWQSVDTHNIQKITRSSQFLPSRLITHHVNAGVNPVVDAAAFLFTILGKLKQLTTYKQFNALQKELIYELELFQNALKGHSYPPEYSMVCRYVLCATFDDVIANTIWGGQGHWNSYTLLGFFNQENEQHEKFFTLLERALKEPNVYIDLMELIYLCLSMGYKGQYRSTEHHQYQLLQITNTLYQHIRAYRGSHSRVLSPAAIKPTKMRPIIPKKNSLSVVVISTACVMMSIFIGFGYLMDMASNDFQSNITEMGRKVSALPSDPSTLQ